MNFLYSFYNSIFGPLLNFGNYTAGALLTVGVLSVIISLILALFYKFLMDQKEAKNIKDNIKELRDKVNEAKKSNDLKKMNQYMKQNLELNHKLFKMSMKPMLASLLLAFLIFPWIHYTFNPELLLERQNQSYVGGLNYLNLNVSVTANESKVVTFKNYGSVENRGYIDIEGSKWQVKSISFSKDKKNAKVRVSLVFINLPFYLPFIERSLEWFGYYFILGIPLTYIFRKLLKVT